MEQFAKRAAPTVVSRLVVKEGMWLAAPGIALGLRLTPAAAGMLGSRQDPAACAMAAVVLSLVLQAACWLPARRAARIDPVEALRAE